MERNNLDVEKFYTGDDGYMHYSDDNIKDTLVGVESCQHSQSDIDWETLAKNKDIRFCYAQSGLQRLHAGRADAGFKL